MNGRQTNLNHALRTAALGAALAAACALSAGAAPHGRAMSDRIDPDDPVPHHQVAFFKEATGFDSESEVTE
jgi:hypothetical protein